MESSAMGLSSDVSMKENATCGTTSQQASPADSAQIIESNERIDHHVVLEESASIDERGIDIESKTTEELPSDKDLKNVTENDIIADGLSGQALAAESEDSNSDKAITNSLEPFMSEGASTQEENDPKSLGDAPESKPVEKIDSFSDDEIQIDSDGDSSCAAESNTDDDSSLSDTSSDSSDDSDSDSETTQSKNDDPVDEVDEEDEAIAGPIMSKNEVADEKANTLPADYAVPENAPLEYIGTLTGLVEKSAIIKANVSGEFRILKDDSVLCFEDRQLLGPLFETFGRLQAPNYRVKFNSEAEFEKIKDKKGSKIFYVVPSSQFVYTDALKKLKGTDASNCHDEELPEDEQEYSDDEQELAAKQEKNRKRKQKKQDSGDTTQKKKPAASKPENSFVSYGFAPKPTERPSTQGNLHPKLQHYNPALHSPAFTQPPSNYGMPFTQIQNSAYGQPQSSLGHQSQFPMQQPYAQQQAYVPTHQIEPYAQSYSNPYGQPYNPALATPSQQYQEQSYGQPPVGSSNMQHFGNPQQYGQPYQPHMSSQGYPVQHYAQNSHPENRWAQAQPHARMHNDAPNQALQQLQQMVSQNLAKEQNEEK